MKVTSLWQLFSKKTAAVAAPAQSSAEKPTKGFVQILRDITAGLLPKTVHPAPKQILTADTNERPKEKTTTATPQRARTVAVSGKDKPAPQPGLEQMVVMVPQVLPAQPRPVVASVRPEPSAASGSRLVCPPPAKGENPVITVKPVRQEMVPPSVRPEGRRDSVLPAPDLARRAQTAAKDPISTPATTAPTSPSASSPASPPTFATSAPVSKQEKAAVGSVPTPVSRPADVETKGTITTARAESPKNVTVERVSASVPRMPELPGSKPLSKPIERFSQPMANAMREIQTFWQKHIAVNKTPAAAPVPVKAQPRAVAAPAPVPSQPEKGTVPTLQSVRAAPLEAKPTRAATRAAQPIRVAAPTTPAEKIAATPMQPVRGTAPAAPVIHAVPAAQPMQAAGQPAPVAQPVQVAKPVQPIIMPSKPMEEATTPVQGKKSATKTSPRTTVQSAPAKTDPIQSERLGGTETPSRKDDRLNDGETLRPAADVMPRSFWGVKVHKEAHPLHVEDVSRAPATDTVQQGAVKAVEGHGTRADTRSGEPATASDMVRREQHTDAKADNGFSSHTPDQSQKQTQSPEPVRAVSEKPADVPHVKTDEPSQSTPQAVTPGKEFAREVAGDAAVSSPLPRAVFTLEQIKDLQAMVSKSLQGTRTTLDGSKEAVFKWNHEALGPLAFRISAKNSDVEIRIQSGRKDVADALEEGRPAMERIFADLGLKMERFEVKVRGEAMSHEPTTQTQEREHSQHGRKANSEAATGTNMDMELETEEEAPQRAPALADREWVA